MRALWLLPVLVGCDWDLTGDRTVDTDDPTGSCPSGMVADGSASVNVSRATLDGVATAVQISPDSPQDGAAAVCVAPDGNGARLLFDVGGVPAGRLEYTASSGFTIYDVTDDRAIDLTVAMEGITENPTELVTTWNVGSLSVIDDGLGAVSLTAAGLGGTSNFGAELTLSFSVAASTR